MDIKFLKELTNKNDFEYNLLKLAEECTELSTELVTYFTKTQGRKARKIKITKELGDVKIRLTMLENQLDNKLLQKHINEKVKALKKNSIKYNNV